jgi:hypothetical protein
MPLPPATAPLHFDPIPDLLPETEPPHVCGLVDPAAIAAVTQLHREVLPAGGSILDVM